MCHFVSFVIHRTDFEIFAGELNSHAGIEEGWGLKSDSYREAEWTQDDSGESLRVRVTKEEDESSFRAAMLARFPKRSDLLEWITLGKTDKATCHYNYGKLHREDGPAVEYADGSKEWWWAGELHREDGPAVEYADDRKEWYWAGELQSRQYTK